MDVIFTISGPIVDRPLQKVLHLDEEDEVIELDNGTRIKLKELRNEALQQYLYAKYVEGTALEGRIVKLEIKNCDFLKSALQ